MNSKVPFSYISKGRIIAISVIVITFLGAITNLLFPESSPLNLTKYEETASIESVYISGEVVNPGVYQINSDSKLVELIEQAGGFTEQADSDFIATDLNLAAIIQNQDHIHIPKFEPTTQEPTASVGNKVNINQASLESLILLPGIGESTAQNIITGRPYSSKEDILSISGIGDAKLALFIDQIEF